ncbi:endonuclease/exonuclease/phosphatase family protein [Vibrio cortegadensis]|uniref:UPF0294 protein ACED38_01525 n=1 Tax=Vibrio cortegadensis TaxID=1328770 RepID=A0ABV4M1F2_9VIBR
MKKKLVSVLSIVALVFLGFSLLFSVPPTPEVISSVAGSNQKSLQCFDNPSPKAIDQNGELNVLVWNIYKQQRSNWREELKSLSEHRQLMLLQEASMTDELKGWIAEQSWGSNQANAFEVFNVGAGVLNLATNLPIQACAYTDLEPWLRLPKSALRAYYQLSDGSTLGVINVHAVNFTFGTQEYQQQLNKLEKSIRDHKGPLIVAGDFNSWSDARVQAMKNSLRELGVQEVHFNPDNRTQFVTGLTLDHIFYRGLELKNAKAPMTDASDHNPLQVSFKLVETD